MKRIYKTKLLGIKNNFYLNEYTKVNKNFYDETDNLIEQEIKECISNNQVLIDGIKEDDLIEIESDSNKKVIMPKHLIDSTIYVTKTIIPNVVKEVVTGTLFKVVDFEKKKLSEKNIYGVDCYQIEVLSKPI